MEAVALEVVEVELGRGMAGLVAVAEVVGPVVDQGIGNRMGSVLVGRIS